MPETTRKRSSASKPSLSTGNLPDAPIVAPKPVKARNSCAYDSNGNQLDAIRDGRPVEYTEAIADEVCLRLTEGEPLVRIE